MKTPGRFLVDVGVFVFDLVAGTIVGFARFVSTVTGWILALLKHLLLLAAHGCFMLVAGAIFMMIFCFILIVLRIALLGPSAAEIERAIALPYNHPIEVLCLTMLAALIIWETVGKKHLNER